MSAKMTRGLERFKAMFEYQPHLFELHGDSRHIDWNICDLNSIFDCGPDRLSPRVFSGTLCLFVIGL